MTAFFVHGVPETHRLWDPVVARLDRKDVVAIDLPGFSSPVPAGFDASKEAYVDWLIARIEAVGAPVDLVAHDWGAMLTLRVASLRPDLVKSWAGGGCAIDADYPWHALAKLWQTPGKGEKYFANFDRATMTQRLIGDGESQAEADRIVAAVDARMGDCILKLYRSAVNVGREWQPGLAKIAAPTLVIHGSKDQPVPPQWADALARDIRAPKPVMLDAGHWYPLQRPDEMVAALQAFWKNAAPFPNRPRVDAREKVMGAARYGADFVLPDMLYAMQVPATIAKGRVTAVPVDAAMRVPGVVRVLLAADFPPPAPMIPGAPPAPAMITADIAYRGQPVALVVAETLEAAIEGAEAIKPVYAAAPSATVIDARGAMREPVKDTVAGNAAGAMAKAKTRHKAEYVSPAQHHNPMELLSTTAHWKDGVMTLYEGSQSSNFVKGAVVRNLRLKPEQVVAKSPQIGGAFGQKGLWQRQTTLVARASMLLGRPVKLVVPRGQVFHNATFRPLSRHTIELGADASGKLCAIRYDADHQASRQGQFPPDYHEHVPMMYGVADYLGTAANVRIDTQDPGFMRCPYPHPAAFAFESAVDELAYKLNVDPVAFRLRHHATTDPIKKNPLSSNFLNDCLTEGARRFGWDRRTMAPGSMTLPDGTQIGWGVGCGAYPTSTTPGIATLRIGADGTTRYAVTGHEMGQGIRTVMEQVLLKDLAIDPAGLFLDIGDTSAAPQHTTAGSWGASSAVTTAAAATAKLNAAMAELLAGRTPGGNLHRQLAAIKRPYLEISVETLAPGQTAKDLATLRMGGFASAGPEYPTFTTFSYIAHFVEVRVEPRTRRIRVPRAVTVADCGRVISPRTAESQIRGGVIWGFGAALREATEVDTRYGGWLNNDLADYVVPVNLDIGEIDVAMIDRPDPLVNPLGAKGLGEVAMSGASGAIANAVFHATGKRIREMPFTIEKLL